MIHFVGAGSGAADLITVRGRKFLEEADVIIYAGSLVNPELLNYAKEACKIYDSAKMTLEEVLDVMRQAEKDGQMTVRLHTGDPCIYGAIREQMDVLDAENISYDYCPGVSSFCGAASALNMEYTLPGVSQSVIITRMAAVSLPSHHGIVKHLQELHRAGCTGQWVASQLLNALGVQRPGFLCCTPDGTLNGGPLAAPLV